MENSYPIWCPGPSRSSARLRPLGYGAANFANEIWRCGAESNRRIELLQSSALPLGYRTEVKTRATWVKFMRSARTEIHIIVGRVLCHDRKERGEETQTGRPVTPGSHGEQTFRVTIPMEWRRPRCHISRTRSPALQFVALRHHIPPCSRQAWRSLKVSSAMPDLSRAPRPSVTMRSYCSFVALAKGKFNPQSCASW